MLRDTTLFAADTVLLFAVAAECFDFIGAVALMISVNHIALAVAFGPTEGNWRTLAKIVAGEKTTDAGATSDPELSLPSRIFFFRGSVDVSSSSYIASRSSSP